MTIAEQMQIVGKENATIKHIQALVKKGFDANFIVDTFKVPRKKVEEIIQKIRESNQ